MFNDRPPHRSRWRFTRVDAVFVAVLAVAIGVSAYDHLQPKPTPLPAIFTPEVIAETMKAMREDGAGQGGSPIGIDLSRTSMGPLLQKHGYCFGFWTPAFDAGAAGLVEPARVEQWRNLHAAASKTLLEKLGPGAGNTPTLPTDFM